MFFSMFKSENWRDTSKNIFSAIFQKKIFIFKVPAIFENENFAARALGGGCAKNFFFMVSEQVNLNHERPPYGKIEKKY